jgi:hypothetical protein
MNITRRIHLNPQSKGNLGKSFEAEFRAAWLDKFGIPWNGSDLDDRHHTFSQRHPDNVRSYQLGNEHESKTTLLSLFRRVLKDPAPVHLIDTRAQADALILSALEELQVLDICADEGVRLTFFLFPTDDTESMNNVGKLFLYGGDSVDYVIVQNPAKARGDLFKGSQLEKRLLEYGAKTITLPMITPTTLLAAEKTEAAAKRGLSFAELSQPGHLKRLLAGEIQWAMQKMFRQYSVIANLLLPTELVPKEQIIGTNEPPKTEPQPQLNFEE